MVRRAYVADADSVRAGTLARRCGACHYGRAVDCVWIVERGLPFLAFLCRGCVAQVVIVDPFAESLALAMAATG